MRFADSLALASAGKSKLARMAMMAITTSNSISVNAFRFLGSLNFIQIPLFRRPANDAGYIGNGLRRCGKNSTKCHYSRGGRRHVAGNPMARMHFAERWNVRFTPRFLDRATRMNRAAGRRRDW